MWSVITATPCACATGSDNVVEAPGIGSGASHADHNSVWNSATLIPHAGLKAAVGKSKSTAIPA